MGVGPKKLTLAIVVIAIAAVGIGGSLVLLQSGNLASKSHSISISVEDFSSLVNSQGTSSDVGGRITVNNTSSVRIDTVSVYVNDWKIGTCGVQIDPDQSLLLVSPCARGNVPCSSLQGGMPYVVKVVATFIDGGTSTTSGSYSGMTAGSC